MEETMTNDQMNTLIKMVIYMLDGCKDVEEAKEKLKALLDK